MTNYRIGAEFDHIDRAKQGQGYRVWKYSFTVLILGRLHADVRVSKQMDSVGAPHHSQVISTSTSAERRG